jgi:Flp pilus assembly protein TadB
MKSLPRILQVALLSVLAGAIWAPINALAAPGPWPSQQQDQAAQAPTSPNDSQGSISAARQIFFLLDESGSMSNVNATTARTAIRDLVLSLPANVAIGFNTFGSDAQRLIKPTLDKPSVIAALSAQGQPGDTALYESIAATARSLQSLTSTRIVIVTDGKDTVSKMTPNQLTQILISTGIPVDFIAVDTDAEHAALLKRFAAATGGQYTTAANASQLARAVQDSANLVPAPAATPVNSAPADSTLQTTAQPEPGTGVPGALALSGFLSVAGVFGALGLMATRRQESRRYERVLDYYSSTPTIATTLTADEGASRLADWKDRYAKSDYFQQTLLKLDAAELALAPSRWLMIQILAGLALWILMAWLFKSVVFGLIIGGLLGWFVNRSYLQSRVNSRLKEFEVQLPDLLVLIASGLRSGLSFSQALAWASEEGSTQVARQLRRASAEARVGGSLDEALLRLADRMHSNDLRWTVQALTIQRQVGGNLSDILDTAATTVRERAKIAREVHGLSAEGRLSAVILGLLPVFVFAFFFLTRRNYVEVFWTKPAGMLMALALIAILIIGTIWMRSITKIRV